MRIQLGVLNTDKKSPKKMTSENKIMARGVKLTATVTWFLEFDVQKPLLVLSRSCYLTCVLVYSYCDIDYLKGNLDKYMSQFPKVRILRLKERHGLIRARLAGAQNATGKKLPILFCFSYIFVLVYLLSNI